MGSSAPSAERTATRKGKDTVAIHDTDAGSKLVPQHESVQELADGPPSPPEKRRRVGINPRNVNGNLPKRIVRESPPPFKIPAKPPTKTPILPPGYHILSRDDDNEQTKCAGPAAKHAVISSHSPKGRPAPRRPPGREVVNLDPPDSGEESPQTVPARKPAANASPTAEALRTASLSKKRKAEEPILREPTATSSLCGSTQAEPSRSSPSTSTSAAGPTSAAAGPLISTANRSSPTAAHSGPVQQPTAIPACPPATVPSTTGFASTAPAPTAASFTSSALVLATTTPSNAAGTYAAPVVVQTNTHHSIAAFVQQLRLLAQLLQLGLDELAVERLDELWFHIRNDWRVDNMNTFLQGFMVASGVSPVQGW